jgi:hypothetical protein
MLTRRSLPLVALVLTLAIAACGGGTKAARTAQYKADSTTIFKAVVDATGQKYKVERADAPSLTLITVPRWFEPDGTYEDQNYAGNGVEIQDGSILLRYLIRVLPGAAPDTFKVEVTPQMQQRREGYAAPIELKEDDMAVPGWVHGKTDDLYEMIYASLKTYAVVPAAAS